MASDPLDSPKWRAVQERIQDLLNDLIAQGDLGKRKCAHEEDWEDCEVDGCTYDDTEQVGTGTVAESYVLLVQTSALEGLKGDSFGMINSVGLKRTNMIGMLTVARDEW